MKFTAKQIAEVLQGKVEGNADASVHKLAKIEEGVEGAISFLANPQYTPFIYDTKASVVIVNDSFVPDKKIAATLIRVPDAYAAFAKLLEFYDQYRANKKGISSMAFIAKSATVGDDCYIAEYAHIGENVKLGKHVKVYPHAVIGDNSVVGNNTTIYAGVKIYHESQIGNHVTLHAGVVVGSDGFGFAPNSDNNYKKVPQIGNVIIEDHVEVGSNTTIDRATLGSTIIRKGVKLDNLIQIAHNVEIGENTVIASQTGIAGSTKIGKNCMIGGQVGIIGHLTIADGIKIAAQSGIGNNITTPNEIVQGSPSFTIGDYKRSYVLFRKLPEIMQRLQELEKKLK